jgi:hypothetical protein
MGVCPVDAVKIAHADHGWAKVGGNVLEFVEDLHEEELLIVDF